MGVLQQAVATASGLATTGATPVTVLHLIDLSILR
jgi:hypothetical protein